MDIKYAVVSSNSNREYLDFWPYVARAWKKIGIEPVIFYIDSKYDREVEKHGKSYYFDSLMDWSIIQQAQSIRLWASKVLDGNFIISDMDMLPISEDYYKRGTSAIGESGITSYSSDIIKYRWYRTNPQYPMCYLAGDPKSFNEILELDRFSDHKEFLRHLKSLNMRFGTDQKFFYNQSQKNRHIKINHLERGWIEEKYATRRLDKTIWPKTDYNVDEYIDCHLPRPLFTNRDLCYDLFKKLNIDL